MTALYTALRVYLVSIDTKGARTIVVVVAAAALSLAILMQSFHMQQQLEIRRTHAALFHRPGTPMAFWATAAAAVIV